MKLIFVDARNEERVGCYQEDGRVYYCCEKKCFQDKVECPPEDAEKLYIPFYYD